MKTIALPKLRVVLAAILILPAASFASAASAAAETDPVARLAFELGPRGHGPVAALPTMEIELGEGDLRSAQPVAIIDLPVFETLGLADRPAMLLGTNFLRGRRLGLDYAGGRIFLFD